MSEKMNIYNFVKLIIKRQTKKNAGTNVLIYGATRTGKTTLGFRILIIYLTLMKELYKRKLSEWKVPKSWKTLFINFFALNCGDMMDKLKKNPDRSFNFVDEGDDLFSWTGQLEREQRELTKLILKAGFKRLLNITVVPSISLLSKNILSQGHYLFIIPKEPNLKDNSNYALMFRNFENPILREKNPFGFFAIERIVNKQKIYAKRDNFESLLKRSPCYVTTVKFKPINSRIYELYEKIVKSPLFEGDMERKHDVVSYARFKKLEYMFNTLLHNLFTKEDFSVARIEKNFIDKFGDCINTKARIQRALNIMAGLEIKPSLTEKDIFAKDKKAVQEHKDVEDVIFD